jgi:amidophosphoribosyltransferase
MGHDGDLMAARLSVEEMCREVGADSLGFLSIDGMMRAVGREEGYCNACFHGRYPLPVQSAQAKLAFEGVLA